MKHSILFCMMVLLLYSYIFGQNNPALLFNKNLENQNKITQQSQAKKRFQLKYTDAYYYEKGSKLKLQGKLREAVQNYEYSILLNPSCANCYRSLGEIYYFLGQYPESISYLKKSLQYPFSFEFDKMKSQYLLIINYFKLLQTQDAINGLNQLAADYQSAVDRQVINGLNIKYEYYAPAFFLLSLYYQNEGNLGQHIIILQKALQLGFKKEYINYFFYEYYQNNNQDSIAFEYLKQSKEIDPQIEVHIKNQPFLKNYDIYKDIMNY